MHLFSPVHHPRSVRFLSPGASAAKGSSSSSRLLCLIPALALILACGDQGALVGVDPEPAAPSGLVTLGHDFLPPPEDYARGGYVIPDGFWEDWRVRSHSHDNCGQPVCVRFHDHGSYGSMGDHTQGVYYLGQEMAYEGEVSMRIRFNNGTLGVSGSGRHLLGITSRPLIFTPREIGLDTWTRVDFDRPEPGRVRAVVFNNVDGESLNGTRWPTHWFDVPFAVGRWADVEIGWRMQGNRLTVTVNGDSHTFTLLPGSEPLGYYLGFGNMDPITGEIDFDDIRLGEGGPPPPPPAEVAYERN